MALDANEHMPSETSSSKRAEAKQSEITHLKKELKQTQADLRLILDNVPARIWYKDANNKIVRLNELAAESMGLTINDAEGADTYDLFPVMAKKYHDDDLAVINSGTARRGIIEEYTPDKGEHGWVSTDKIPLIDPGTGQKYVLVISQDITRQKLIEDSLRENEARLREVLNACYDGYWERNF